MSGPLITVATFFGTTVVDVGDSGIELPPSLQKKRQRNIFVMPAGLVGVRNRRGVGKRGFKR